jgi:GrpB-like predicted nucleotidyltransferase (UPF0157 family)
LILVGDGEEAISMDHDERLIGGLEPAEIVIAEYDPAWPERYQAHARVITDLLGSTLLAIEHVGSTAVPGLAAKPIIDILAVVPDSADESSYLPQLSAAGYYLRVREPDFFEHRMLRTAARDVHLHLFSPEAPEVRRMITFRDRLRRSPEDRARYEAVKRRLAARSWPDMNAYAEAKTEVVESIIATSNAARDGWV